MFALGSKHVGVPSISKIAQKMPPADWNQSGQKDTQSYIDSESELIAIV